MFLDSMGWEVIPPNPYKKMKVAIARAPRGQEMAQEILMRGGSVTPNKTLPEYVAVNAVIYADELVKELQKGHATDYYKEGYHEALGKVRSAIVNGTNNIDRLHAIRLLLEESENGQE